MTRGSRGGAVITSGDRFHLVPVTWARNAQPGERAHDYDLNADVAAALLGVHLNTLRRMSAEGRRRRDTGQLVRLESWLPYGRGSRRRYYALADLERYALDGWADPREIRYDIIPRWYAEKHGRTDLIGRVRPEVPIATVIGDRVLDPAELAAHEAGYPAGTYMVGDEVFSPEGVLLNPDATASEDMHALAEVELAALRRAEK